MTAKANDYGPEHVARKGIPAVGAYRDRYHRYYWNGDGPLISVTTAQAAIAKPAFAASASRKVAEYVARNLADLVRQADDGWQQDQIIDFLRRIPDQDMRRSAEFGTNVHTLLETMSKGLPVEPIGDEVAFANAYARFLDDHNLSVGDFLEREYMVFDLTHRYGGTGDAILMLDGVRTLVDYKTGTAVYPETEFQLAALSAAEFIGREGDATRHPIPKCDRFAVLHVRPAEFDGGYQQGYRLIDHSVTQESIDLFRHLLPIRRWMQVQEKAYRDSKKGAA